MFGFRIRTRRALAATLAAAFGAGSAHAMIVNDALDGAYVAPNTQRQGVLVDFIPQPDFNTGRTGQLFLAFFNYDTDGRQLWAVAQTDVFENEFSWTQVPLVRFTGGSFGGNQDLPGTNIGTINISFNTCNSLDIIVNPTPASGLPQRNWTGMTPIVPRNAAQCVYQVPFTACPSGTTPVANAPRTCQLTGTITDRTLRLTNNTRWVLNGLVQVGNRNANPATVEIEPGTRIFGAGGQADYLYINPGSRIFALGLPNAPIIFTSPRDGVRGGQAPAPGDFGGVVVSGNAPTTCPNNSCSSEFNPALLYGGNNPRENSGVMRFVQIRYAGFVFAPNREVNALTLQAVGDGTRIEYIQAYRGRDDGFEWFGGTVNHKYLVVIDGGDDSFDWDFGWNGRVQYALSLNAVGFGENFGFEGASDPAAPDASPRAVPVFSNVTLIGANGGTSEADAIQFKDGSGGRVWNTVVHNWRRACIELNGLPVFNHAVGNTAVPPSQNTLTGTLVMNNSFLGSCTAGNFRTTVAANQTAPYTTEAWWNAQLGNRTGNPLLTGNSAGQPVNRQYIPQTGSPLVAGGGRVINRDGSIDLFFDNTVYVGAFAGADDDWTRGWTYGF
jgi:hypothetical protein